MDALELLLGRESALRLEPPGPTLEELDKMLDSAVRAPDHGRLRPWRFVIVPEDRRADFGEVMAESLRRREPGASADALQRERDKAMRAPLILIVAAHVQKEHKIPEVEQLCSTAAAAQNIMLAANAQGYGAMWRTGAAAYDPGVKQALGLSADDEIVGFIYLGRQIGGGSPAPRPAARDLMSVWQR
jgi:nitroreductase